MTSNQQQKPFDRLLLYFIIMIGIIAVILWTIFLIQNTTILENQEKSRIDRDHKNQELMIILALLNHETRQLIKLGLDALNITDYHDSNFLNKRHADFPFYFTNKTHITIEMNKTGNKTIEIPYEMSNLLMQFNATPSELKHLQKQLHVRDTNKTTK